MAMKTLLKDLLPPLLWRALKPAPVYGFSGDFASWKDALELCSGYDAPNILEKVAASMRAVREGRAAFERDSVLFDRAEHNWPLLASLLKVASASGGRLRVLDFGGSLGSTYHQCRGFLSDLPEVEWSIIEQAGFVGLGKAEFETAELKFYPTVDACLAERKPDCLLLSSVLAYIEDPFALLRSLVGKRFPYILVDRTGFVPGSAHRLTVQKVPPEIYPATYPAWFLAEKPFLDFFGGDYETVAEFTGADRAGFPSEFKGFLFRLKGAAPAARKV